MMISKTTPSQQIGLTPTERIEKLEKQIKKFWEMFDVRIDKDNAVNGSGKNMLKLSVLEQIVRFEDGILNIKKELIDTGGPFVYHDPYGGIPQRKEHYFKYKASHHLTHPTFWSWWQCKKCGFKTQKISDLRKNNGCNIFANSDTDKTDHRFKFEDIKTERRYLSIQEEAIRGCNIHDRVEWVYYPEIGEAIQNDKFIDEQVRLQCQSSKVK